VPDFAEVNRLLAGLKTRSTTMHANMNEAENLYHLEYGPDAVRVPEGSYVHIPSTASTLIDASRDQISTDTPQVTVIPNGSSEEALATSQLLEYLGTWLVERLQDSWDIPIPRQIVHDLVEFGAAGVLIPFDERKFMAEPERKSFPSDAAFKAATSAWKKGKENTFPFRPLPLDPRKTLGSLSTTQGGDPLRQVDMIAYWTPETYTLFADGEKVIDGINPNKIVPAVWGFSGMGSLHLGADPSDAAVGVLTKVVSELKAEVRLKTAMEAIWQYAAWPRLLTQEDPNTVKAQMDLRAGGIVQWKGEAAAKPQFLDPPSLNPAMYTLLPELKGSIEKGTLQGVLQGERPSGVDFGYLQSLLIGQARLRFGAVKKSLEIFMQRILYLMVFQLQARGHTTSVFGFEDSTTETLRQVKPKDLNGHIEFRVEMGAVDPMDNVSKVTALLPTVAAGLMSPHTYIDKVLGLDPVEEQAWTMAAQVIQQAIASGFLLQEVMEASQTNDSISQSQDIIGQVRGKITEGMLDPGAEEGVPKQKNLGPVGTPTQPAARR